MEVLIIGQFPPEGLLMRWPHDFGLVFPYVYVLNDEWGNLILKRFVSIL